jgi:hypothetical protein
MIKHRGSGIEEIWVILQQVKLPIAYSALPPHQHLHPGSLICYCVCHSWFEKALEAGVKIVHALE